MEYAQLLWLVLSMLHVLYHILNCFQSASQQMLVNLSISHRDLHDFAAVYHRGLK